MDTIDPYHYLNEAECIFQEREITNAIYSVSIEINKDYKKEKPILLSVMNGATYFTGQLLPHLNFPLEIDYVHATRYQKQIEGNQISWIVKPPSNIKGRTVIILDDILDKGVTLKAIVDDCYKLGATDVKTAVLVEKIINSKKSINADYVGLQVPDRYIFGCGMDVFGWWRNLPAIYALKST